MAKKRKSSGKGSKGSSKSSVKILHNKKFVTFVAILVVIILAAVLIVYFFFPEVFNKAKDTYLSYVQTLYNDSADDDPEGTVATSSAPVATGDLNGIVNSEFSIHFLEVGNKYAGDCTLIKCGNTEVLIDAGSRTNSATAISTYVDQYCTDNKLEYVIATHAHQDHIAGFVGTGSGTAKTGILYKYQIGTIIQFALHNTNSGIYNSFVTAVDYAVSNGAKAYTALQCWNNESKNDVNGNALRQYDISQNGDGSLTLNVLYNYYYEHETADENDYSVCVLLTHTAGAKTTNYLFTGDLEGDGESHLVDDNSLPEVELFKGAHHGSKTSSTDKLLKIIKPKNIAVCCCAGSTEYTKNNDNTFPTQAFIDRVSAYTQNVYCTSLCVDYSLSGSAAFTSMNGNIVFYIEDLTLKLWCSNNTTKLKDTDWFKNNRTCPTAWQGTP